MFRRCRTSAPQNRPAIVRQERALLFIMRGLDPRIHDECQKMPILQRQTSWKLTMDGPVVGVQARRSSNGYARP
jgi:hypothetical protein